MSCYGEALIMFKSIGINQLEALALRFSMAALLPYAPDFMIANVFEAT